MGSTASFIWRVKLGLVALAVVLAYGNRPSSDRRMGATAACAAATSTPSAWFARLGDSSRGRSACAPLHASEKKVQPARNEERPDG